MLHPSIRIHHMVRRCSYRHPKNLQGLTNLPKKYLLFSRLHFEKRKWMVSCTFPFVNIWLATPISIVNCDHTCNNKKLKAHVLPTHFLIATIGVLRREDSCPSCFVELCRGFMTPMHIFYIKGGGGSRPKTSFLDTRPKVWVKEIQLQYPHDTKISLLFLHFFR